MGLKSFRDNKPRLIKAIQMGNQLGICSTTEADRLREVSFRSRLQFQQPLFDVINAKLADGHLDRAAKRGDGSMDVSIPMDPQDYKKLHNMMLTSPDDPQHKGIRVAVLSWAPCVVKLHGWSYEDFLLEKKRQSNSRGPVIG